jgi:hypothetical protein
MLSKKTATTTSQYSKSRYRDEYQDDKKRTMATEEQKSSSNGDDGIISEKAFGQLGVCEALCEATQLMGWKNATRIQEKVLPDALAGRDIIGLAETGSGKVSSTRQILTWKFFKFATGRPNNLLICHVENKLNSYSFCNFGNKDWSIRFTHSTVFVEQSNPWRCICCYPSSHT